MRTSSAYASTLNVASEPTTQNVMIVQRLNAINFV